MNGNERAPAPASDLPVRLVMAVAMIAVACLAIYAGGWLLRALAFAGAAAMLFEYDDMHRVARDWSYAGIALLAGNLLIVPAILFDAPADQAIAAADVWRGLGAVLAASVLLGVAGRRPALAGGYLYVGIPAFALLVLGEISSSILFWVMIVTWATDIFAYFAGRAIGGPKLAPTISPNKTWAGLAGGVLGSALLGALVGWAFGLGAPFLFVGGFMGIIAQAGDLYESGMKRRAGVKDSGTLLPGHGGVLDRLDGLLPVVVVTLGLLLAGGWPA